MKDKDNQETAPESKDKAQDQESVTNEPVNLSLKKQQKLIAQVKELEGMKDKLLRSAAEYENAKKRLAKERDEFVRFNQESLIREMLAVLDNFERALDHTNDLKDEAAKGIVAGIELVQKQLTEILKQQGLKRLETKGVTFDPNLHEAVAYVQEEGKEDEIVDEVQPGYMLHDRLLRAAKVRVRMAQEEKK